eukprot:tig00020723_g13523.t1
MGAGSSARSRYPAAEIVGEVEVTPPPKKGPRPPPPRAPPAPMPPLVEPLPPAPPVLYAFEACPECARLELSLRHCKIRYERREEEPLELRLPWYVVTTERPVPRLHHGRHVLEDLPSILQHIEKLPGAAALLPIDFEARARVRVFLLSASNRLTALVRGAVAAAAAAIASAEGGDGAAEAAAAPAARPLRAALAAAGGPPLPLPPRLQAWLPAAEAAAAALGVREPPAGPLLQLAAARLKKAPRPGPAAPRAP